MPRRRVFLLPGGKVKKKASPGDALRRGAREKTGLTAESVFIHLLVPKLSLGTHWSGRLYCLCRAVQTKGNFADKGVPKGNLGTRELGNQGSATWNLGTGLTDEVGELLAGPTGTR